MKHESITLPSAAQYRADTAGWDAVNCVRVTEINDAIRNAGTSPEQMEIELEDGRYAQGEFASWQVAPGGDGQLINLEIPMHNVEIRRNDRQSHLENVIVEVQVRMELISSGRKKALGDNTVEKLLVIAKQPSGLLMGSDGVERAATVTAVVGADDIGVALNSTLRSCVEAWMNENLDKFSHVFAAVNISQRISEDTEGEAFAWLKPTDVSYAFGTSRTDPEASVLAILCQTQGRKIDGLVHQADPGLIPPGCDAGVMVSRSRFLRNMVGEALPNAFKGLKLKDIKYKEKDSGLRIGKKVKTSQVKHEGKTYDPVIHELDLTLRDTEMELKSLTKTKVAPGVFSVCSATAAYAFGLMKRKDGGKTIGFVETRKMKTVDSVEKTKEVTLLNNILMAIAAISGLVLTVISLGSLSAPYFVTMAILLGGVATVGTASIKIVEMVKNGNAPPIDLLMANATGAVRWSTGRTFDPTFAALNNGLQIGGNFVPADTGLMTASTEAGPDFHKAFQAEFADIMKERLDQ